MKFWDSSALVPLILMQTMTRAMEEILQQDPEIVVWWGSLVEVASALARAEREGKFDRAFEQPALRVAGELFAEAYEIQAADEVRQRALRLLRIHPLRAADSLQLSAALVWCGERTAGAGLVCLDSRLRDAGSREGFDLFPDEI